MKSEQEKKYNKDMIISVFIFGTMLFVLWFVIPIFDKVKCPLEYHLKEFPKKYEMLVTKKYRWKENHSTKVLDVMDNHKVLEKFSVNDGGTPTGYRGLWDNVEVGDSLLKNAYEFDIILKKASGSQKVFHCRCDEKVYLAPNPKDSTKVILLDNEGKVFDKEWEEK
jgi:hypothetical protein